MANLAELNKLYQSTVGRDIDKGGFDYWNKQLNQQRTSIDSIKKTLMGGDEYKDRASTVKQYQDAGKGNPDESVLDALGSAYKGQSASMTDQHRAAATASINRGDGVRAGTVPSYSDMYDDTGAMKDTWKGTDKWYETKLTDANTQIKTLTDAAAANTTTAANTSTSSDNSFDQFMKFMTALSGVQGMFGGGGTSYPAMGYGGSAPGGVAAANPYKNMMGFMNAFKSMGSGGDATTSNLLNQS
jgi:hypothetical protein